MNGATMKTTMEKLGITPSASSGRARVMLALIARRLPAAPFSMQRLGHKTRDDGQAKPATGNPPGPFG